jgi:hypothetical protein
MFRLPVPHQHDVAERRAPQPGPVIEPARVAGFKPTLEALSDHQVLEPQHLPEDLTQVLWDPRLALDVPAGLREASASALVLGR